MLRFGSRGIRSAAMHARGTPEGFPRSVTCRVLTTLTMSARGGRATCPRKTSAQERRPASSLHAAEGGLALLLAGGACLGEVRARPAALEGDQKLGFAGVVLGQRVQDLLVVGDGQRGQFGHLLGPGEGGVEVAGA